MTRIRANGIEVHYELFGRTDAPVLILSHSLASSSVMWEPQIEALSSHFPVLRYDTRGHGKSESSPGPYTLELLANDAVGLLDALGIKEVHWVGLSLGGMIGQCVALNHAQRVRSLALCDTAAILPEEAQPVWQERINLALQNGMASLAGATMERWFTPSFLRGNSQMLGLIRREFLNTPVAGYVGCSEAIRKLNYLDRLSHIKIPTLIIVGEDDPGTPVSASEAMHERIADSRLVIIPCSRHLTNVEQPEAFNAALLTFLKGL